MTESETLLNAACDCGLVRIEAWGDPFLVVDCHCQSCRKAAAGFANLPGAPTVLNENGGTPFSMYRKDRLHFAAAPYLLKEHRLSPTAKTRRVVAACCSSPMFLEFAGGHWLSMYRDRIGGAAPAEMRVMTADQHGRSLPNDLPNYKTHSPKFWWRLFSAWVGMGFRIPKVPV